MDSLLKDISWAIQFGYCLVIISMILSAWRLFKGPSVCDRIVALDLIAAQVMCLSGLFVLETGNRVFLDVALAIAVVAFLSTVAFARHLEKRGTEL
ncbi:MAG: monovalent cation/H+ antiporter complex subunit F [Verrucomicrobiota bacterium]